MITKWKHTLPYQSVGRKQHLYVVVVGFFSYFWDFHVFFSRFFSQANSIRLSISISVDSTLRPNLSMSFIILIFVCIHTCMLKHDFLLRRCYALRHRHLYIVFVYIFRIRLNKNAGEREFVDIFFISFELPFYRTQNYDNNNIFEEIETVQ